LLGASDLGNYSFLRASERTSVRLRMEISSGSPPNGTINPGAYRVVVFAQEL
jgi:hypothetical protein